jgi:hypothetical protein
MASIKILDTGYATADKTGTQYTLSNRAGTDVAQTSINSFDLQIENITLNGGGSVQDNAEIKTNFHLSSASPVTHNNPVFLLSCSVARDALPADFDNGFLFQLIKLERTKGVKILYLSDTTNRLPELVELYGIGYKGSAFSSTVGGATIPYVPGYVKSVSNLRVAAGNDKLSFQITFNVLPDTQNP